MNETLKKIFAETFRISPERIDEDTSIDSLETWDSLTHMELVANLESALGLQFSSEEIISMTRFGAIAAIVGAKY